MPRGRRAYPLEFRQRIVELVRVGRRPGELAREFEPTVESINRWVKQADRDEGRLADCQGRCENVPAGCRRPAIMSG